MNEQYRKLSKLIRELEIKELKTGKFPHLRANRKKSKEFNFLTEKIKPVIIFRPAPILKQGKRNIYVGSTEVILEYHGTPKTDYRKGFIVNEDRLLRSIIGDKIPYRKEIHIPIHSWLSNNYTKKLLEEGNYEQFTKFNLKELNRVFESYKTYYQEDLKKQTRVK